MEQILKVLRIKEIIEYEETTANHFSSGENDAEEPSEEVVWTDNPKMGRNYKCINENS